MKIIFFLIILCGLLVTGCKKQEVSNGITSVPINNLPLSSSQTSSTFEVTSSPSTTPELKVLPVPIKKMINCHVNLSKNFVEFAKSGKLIGIDFGIGDSKLEVVKKWGDPVTKADANVYSYSDCSFYFWNENTIGSIKVNLKAEQITFDQIKNLLGSPKTEGLDDAEGSYYLYYPAGKYELYFNAFSKKENVSTLSFKEMG